MRNHLVIAGIVTTALVLGSSAGASDRSGANHFKVDLVGFQEVPAISTTGAAHLELAIDDAAEMITFVMTMESLEGGAPTASHIHLGARGTNGGVSVFFCGGGGKPPCPAVLPATIEGTITGADIIGPAGQGLTTGEFAELVRAIRAGVTYANIHNARFPSGEIRGQINDRDERR